MQLVVWQLGYHQPTTTKVRFEIPVGDGASTSCVGGEERVGRVDGEGEGCFQLCTLGVGGGGVLKIFKLVNGAAE